MPVGCLLKPPLLDARGHLHLKDSVQAGHFLRL